MTVTVNQRDVNHSNTFPMKRTTYAQPNEPKQPPTPRKGFTILANDPSITAWGWAVLDVDCNLLDKGCIKTKTEGKKRRIRKGDEDVHRTEAITSELLRVIKKYNVQYIVTELPHGSQNAAAAKMIGICVGVIVGIALSSDLGVEWYSEGDSKKAALGKIAAHKQEMIDAMSKIYKVKWTGIKYIDEAVADALGIHNVALKESATLKLVNK